MNSLRRLWFLVVGPATRIFNVFTFFLLVWLMTWFDPLCNAMFLFFFLFFKLNFSLATLSASYTYKSINTNDIYIAQVNMLPMDSRGMTFVSCRWSDGFFSVKTGSCEIVTSSAVGRNRVVAADEDKPIESKEREIQRNNSIEEQDKADRSFSAADFRKWKRHGAKFETNFDRNRQMHRQLLFVTQSIRVFFFFLNLTVDLLHPSNRFVSPFYRKQSEDFFAKKMAALQVWKWIPSASGCVRAWVFSWRRKQYFSPPANLSIFFLNRISNFPPP